MILAIVRSSYWPFAVRITAASLTRDWVSVGGFPILLLDGATKHLLSMFDDLNKTKLILLIVTLLTCGNFACVVINCLHTADWCARHWVNGQTRCISLLLTVSCASSDASSSLTCFPSSTRHSTGVCYRLGSKATLSWLLAVFAMFLDADYGNLKLTVSRHNQNVTLMMFTLAAAHNASVSVWTPEGNTWQPTEQRKQGRFGIFVVSGAETKHQ